jgi:Tfp pilus assembly protein PilX
MKPVPHRSPARQRGVVLIFALIVLLILSIGAVALVRSMSTSLFNAGNLAFRRDLVNQGELAGANLLTQLKTGALSTSASTQTDNAAANYYAAMLSTNAQGIPTVLLGTVANPIAGANGVTIYYVIDRLCQASGPTIATQCVQSSTSPLATTIKPTNPLTPAAATVYRLSVRVNGPRNTQVFLQSTFSRED